MTESLVLIENISELKLIKKNISNYKNKKIISFSYNVHNYLEKENISHKNADEYLTKNERYDIFDKTISLLNWHDKQPLFNELEFEGINLLGLLDTTEFNKFLHQKLFNFLILLRIVENENPKKIYSPTMFLAALDSITNKKKIDVVELESKITDGLYWDKFSLKFDYFSKTFSINLSRSKYNLIKYYLESCLTYILKLNPKISRKKSLLFLEFDINNYSKLIQNLQGYDGQILFLNKRKPALYDLNAIKSIKKLNCNILNIEKINRHDFKLIKEFVMKYNEILDKIWKNDKVFDEIFSIEGYSYWKYIKNQLLETYKSRLEEYIAIILASKKILKIFNISCIVSLNVVGETEKTILNINKNKIPSIMLEHAYANYTQEISRYDVLSMYSLFKDKIAVWGNTQKNYLIKQHNIDEKQIILTGSPRHDDFFKKKILKPKQKIILLTITPISNISGQVTIDIYEKFEKVIRNICKIIQEKHDLKLIVKLHPGQPAYNSDIVNLFKQIDPKITVFSSKPIIDLLSQSDTLLNISPEGIAPSTVMIEALILKIPVMNIILDKSLYNFQFVKDNSILNVLDIDKIEKHFCDIVYDLSIRNNFIKNGKNHIENYLVNHGVASETFAKILKSY